MNRENSNFNFSPCRRSLVTVLIQHYSGCGACGFRPRGWQYAFTCTCRSNLISRLVYAAVDALSLADIGGRENIDREYVIPKILILGRRVKT